MEREGIPPSAARGRGGEACGGTPSFRRPGPSASEQTRQGGGASCWSRSGDVPTHILCKTSPDPLAAQNVEGTLSKLHGEGRHERCVQVCSTNLVTVDTTCFKYLFLLSKSPFM